MAIFRQSAGYVLISEFIFQFFFLEILSFQFFRLFFSVHTFLPFPVIGETNLRSNFNPAEIVRGVKSE